MRRRGILAGLLLLAAARPDVGRAEEAFRVIVHPSNAGGQISKATLATIFLKQNARWPDGKPVAAVDQSAKSAVRAAFCEHALGQSVQAVQQFWMQAIALGRGVPPLVKTSDSEVIAFVSGTPGSIGYVSSEAALDATVKLVRVVD